MVHRKPVSLMLVSISLAAAVLASCTAVTSEPGNADAGIPAITEMLAASNGHVFEVAEAEDRFLTLKGLRTAVIMHLAVHDSLNAVRPRYETYLPVSGAPEADPLAAAAQAAFEVARSQYPDREARFRSELEARLATVDEGPQKTRGISLGRRVATRILEERADDDWDAEAEYRWHPMGPGVYAEFNEHSGTPEGFVFGAGWALARPFALKSPDHFRAPPPPEIDSEEYTRAFGEVKEVGAHESATRTADQTHLAMWWKEFVESSHNRLARRLVVEEGLDPWKAARLFAHMNMGIYDGYVNVFFNKFEYNHWRPYTGIRWASNDGNPKTEEDPNWDNLHRHTYAFPSYPSAHGTVCAAAMTALADTFGESRPVTMTIERVDRAGPLSDKIPMEPSTRSFDSFWAAAEECSLSRVYLGIHFRYDSVAGTELGRRIGSYVVDNLFRPFPEQR